MKQLLYSCIFKTRVILSALLSDCTFLRLNGFLKKTLFFLDDGESTSSQKPSVDVIYPYNIRDSWSSYYYHVRLSSRVLPSQTLLIFPWSPAAHRTAPLSSAEASFALTPTHLPHPQGASAEERGTAPLTEGPRHFYRGGPRDIMSRVF